MRTAFTVYTVYLSILLLSQNPERWIGATSGVTEFLRMLAPLAHVISFSILSFLTFASALPLPRWGLLCLLALYGGVTELIQYSVPHRTPDWVDWFQDLSGIIIGFLCFSLIICIFRMVRKTENLPAQNRL
jgi:VanZ family protein